MAYINIAEWTPDQVTDWIRGKCEEGRVRGQGKRTHEKMHLWWPWQSHCPKSSSNNNKEQRCSNRNFRFSRRYPLLPGIYFRFSPLSLQVWMSR